MLDAPKKYRARKDLLGALLIAVIFSLGCLLVWQHRLVPVPRADMFGWLFVVFGVLSWWEYVVTSYQITDEELIIRGGLSSRRMPLSAIDEMALSRGLFSGETVRVKCFGHRGSKWLTLTPRQAEAFCQRLYKKAPWLRSRSS